MLALRIVHVHPFHFSQTNLQLFHSPDWMDLHPMLILTGWLCKELVGWLACLREKVIYYISMKCRVEEDMPKAVGVFQLLVWCDFSVDLFVRIQLCYLRNVDKDKLSNRWVNPEVFSKRCWYFWVFEYRLFFQSVIYVQKNENQVWQFWVLSVSLRNSYVWHSDNLWKRSFQTNWVLNYENEKSDLT